MSSDGPWLTILTPVANGWEFLGLCAEGVFAQTEKGWDWWIGINGSGLVGEGAVGAGRVVLQKAAALGLGDRVHVICLPEVRGKVEAMNALVDIAPPTPWVAVLDCDDVWLPRKLGIQKMILDKAVAERPRLTVIGSWCNYIGAGIKVPFGPKLPPFWVPPAAFAAGNPIVNSSALIRRSAARWEDRFGLDDYDLWLRILKEGGEFFNVPEILVLHRLHAGSAFNGKGGQDVRGLLAWHGLGPAAPAKAADANKDK
jgi:hypothetical protein